MIDRIKKVLHENLNIDPNKIAPTTHVLDDLGLDSLDFVELVMSLEDEFKVKISDEEVMNVKTIQDVINLLKKKTN